MLIDTQAYFDAAMKAMRRARHTVHLLNWAFEAQTLFHPKPGCTGPDSDRIGVFLKTLAADKPHLDVRLLCWKSALPVAATQDWFTLKDRKAFAGSKVKLVLDGKLPLGASHHQKAIIVDDAIAFCGGIDIGPERWDTPLHLDDDPRRAKASHAHGHSESDFDSRHELMGVVAGAPAKSLGDLFRDRWARATGERLSPPPPTAPAWPSGVEVQFHEVSTGLSRTYGIWRRFPEVREVERLHLDSIAAARRCIYMENQYFTSPLIAAALARRLAEPGGPEVVLIGTEHSPSYFDQATMDRTRVRFLETLLRADKHKRLKAYSPVTALGRIIVVHAKLTIIDDDLLRIASANINNRSMGFDSECDLSFEAAGRTAARTRRQIAALRTRLAAHWLGCGEQVVLKAVHEAGGVGAGLEALRQAGYVRLRPLQIEPVSGFGALIAGYHVGDPFTPADSWRCWRRKREAKNAARRGAASR
ncbi:MAG TPA: phospholipase D-like domain-containing protein [Caulobacteraceae bacterium]|nr:phospholipase D-like domain-containing protein [Caulobacteraceae bacterium]